MKFNRILLKVSGAALGKSDSAYSKEQVDNIADIIKNAYISKLEIAIVVGGGNVFRGRESELWNFERCDADKIGMMSTVLNSLVLKNCLKAKGLQKIVIMTPYAINGISETFDNESAINLLEKGYVVIFAAGIGQPFLSTDYPSVQRAIEIKVDALIMAKNGISGVCEQIDNVLNYDCVFETLNYEEAIQNKYEFMDYQALLLGKQFKLPIYVYGFGEPNAVLRICQGEKLGTEIGVNIKTIHRKIED